MMLRLPLAIAGAVVLASCGGQSDDTGSANDAAANGSEPEILEGGTVDVLPADESIATPTNDLATGVIDTPPRQGSPVPNPKTAIPSGLHGRWGLTRADCTSERGDAKGLITISGPNISFYESVAIPAKIHKATPTGIHAEFAFTGEGQSWTSPMIWSVSGDKLTRIDSEADSRLVYTRC